MSMSTRVLIQRLHQRKIPDQTYIETAVNHAVDREAGAFLAKRQIVEESIKYKFDYWIIFECH